MLRQDIDQPGRLRQKILYGKSLVHVRVLGDGVEGLAALPAAESGDVEVGQVYALLLLQSRPQMAIVRLMVFSSFHGITDNGPEPVCDGLPRVREVDLVVHPPVVDRNG